MALQSFAHRYLAVFFVSIAPLAPAKATEGAVGSVRDFDWEIGEWETRVSVRAPLSEANSWTEFRGVSNVRALSGGRANFVELDVLGGTRRIAGVSLRLFNPSTQKWSLNFASFDDGALTAPLIGGFQNGRGLFFGKDQVGRRNVQVRFEIVILSPGLARFVQSFSADGGQTWIDNWIATDTRVERK